MKAHQNTVGITDVWGTPLWILEPLGHFDLDPCAMPSRLLPCISTHLTEEDDGLTMAWDGRVWLNPPFNRYQRPRWMERMAKHNNGIMLIPAACETDAFQRYVWGKASGILMLSRRPHFVAPDGTEAKANSGCTICLVAYGEENARKLRASGLGVLLAEVA